MLPATARNIPSAKEVRQAAGWGHETITPGRSRKTPCRHGVWTFQEENEAGRSLGVDLFGRSGTGPAFGIPRSGPSMGLRRLLSSRQRQRAFMSPTEPAMAGGDGDDVS